MLTKSERIKAIKGSLGYERRSHGMTQAELGEAIDNNQATISSWESGDGSINLERAWAIADVYGIPLDQLAGRA
jgi:transcriptional regulator with XRE-family HTH domain